MTADLFYRDGKKYDRTKPMDVIYGLIPGMILLGLLGVGVFFWAARTGQFEDLEGEASRILMDDDLPPEKPVVKNPASYEVSEQKSSDQQG